MGHMTDIAEANKEILSLNYTKPKTYEINHFKIVKTKQSINSSSLKKQHPYLKTPHIRNKSKWITQSSNKQDIPRLHRLFPQCIYGIHTLYESSKSNKIRENHGFSFTNIDIKI